MYISQHNYHLILQDVRTNLRYGDTLLESEGETSISTRPVKKNHRSFFFYFNVFPAIWRHFGNIQRCWATTACKPCFALYKNIRHLYGCSVRIFYVFGIDVLSRMSSSLLCIAMTMFDVNDVRRFRTL